MIPLILPLSMSISSPMLRTFHCWVNFMKHTPMTTLRGIKKRMRLVVISGIRLREKRVNNKSVG